MPISKAYSTTGKEISTILYEAILPTIGQPREAWAIIKCILGHYFQYDPTDTMLNKPLTITQAQNKWLVATIQRIRKHEPIQYILGETIFMGRGFQVSPAVLIPRPETEELVYQIIQENPPPGLDILDIGTGSGCIAITLHKALKATRTDALDISQQALIIAEANAQRWEADVNFIQADILHDPLPEQHWNIIVSNPPYVRLSEYKWMKQHVLAYEPRQALFVPDEDPLVFYKKIASLALMHLKPGGKIYLEINEAFGRSISNLLDKVGLEAIRLQQDMQGKDRWVTAIAPSNKEIAGINQVAHM